MSTPVSISTPPHSKKTVRRSNNSETDHQQLVEHMQRMIDLQYQQQRLQEEAQMGESMVPEHPPVPKESLSQTNSGQSASTPNILSGLQTEFDDSFVGKGTLLWRTSSDHLLASYRMGSFLSNNSTGTSVDEQDGDVMASTRLLPTLNKSTASHAALQLSNTYGSIPDATQISHSNLDVLFRPPPPPPIIPQPPVDYVAALYPNATVHPPPPPPPYDGASASGRALPTDEFSQRREAFEANRRNHWWFYVHRCLFMPLQRCCYGWFMAESLHRSFCYGAIDGMLTGAGIVSTFCGMHLLSTTSTVHHPSRALVVAFTAAACFADAVCMAIGHVWTTRVLAEARANERLQARYQLLHTKADAKGVLVDLLLARGMLKIDAMSLADTLEGYPDLFVNVLTGDALSAGIASVPARPPPLPLPDLPVVEGDEDERLLSDSPGARQYRPSPVAYHSYGRLTEYEMDPDQYTVQSLGAESRKESLCMMLGFSLFSVVPSLLYALVPALLWGPHATGAASSSSDTTTTNTATTVNPNSLILFLTAGVMWCLGIWKSRFLDSNWVLYGMETVGVLLICMACAYSLGALLNHVFLPDDYVLQVVPHTDHSLRVEDHGGDTEDMTPTAAHQIHPHQWYLF
jgi:VIT family